MQWFNHQTLYLLLSPSFLRRRGHRGHCAAISPLMGLQGPEEREQRNRAWNLRSTTWALDKGGAENLRWMAQGLDNEWASRRPWVDESWAGQHENCYKEVAFCIILCPQCHTELLRCVFNPSNQTVGYITYIISLISLLIHRMYVPVYLLYKRVQMFFCQRSLQVKLRFAGCFNFPWFPQPQTVSMTQINWHCKAYIWQISNHVIHTDAKRHFL